MDPHGKREANASLSRETHREIREFREGNLLADLPDLPVNKASLSRETYREIKEFREEYLLPDLPISL